MRRWAAVALLLLATAVIAGMMQLHRIQMRWLTWTPVEREIWIWPAGEPNELEFYRWENLWGDPNRVDFHTDISMPSPDGRDRILRVDTRCRYVDLSEY